MKEIIIDQQAAASDGHIIARILSGDSALFEILVRRTNAALYKIARGYGFSHQDAEDLMQEAHVAAYRHLGTFAGRSAYKTWISRIMINQCFQKLRKDAVRNEIVTDPSHTETTLEMQPIDHTDPAQTAHNRELAAFLHRSLQAMPLTLRSVFLLREMEGHSVADTAEMLDITQVNVKVRLNRAKALLQKRLESTYSKIDLYEFHLRYCDAIVAGVFERISCLSHQPGADEGQVLPVE
jgi:RNA polymerase sigma factor (sigma-70 family)